MEDNNQQNMFLNEDDRDPDIRFRKEDFNMDSPFDGRLHDPKYKKRKSGQGRKMGSLGERKKIIYMNLMTILEEFPIEQTILDMQAMKPYERQRSLNDMREYVLPKIVRSSINIESDTDTEIIVRLPDMFKQIGGSSNKEGGKLEDSE